MVELGVNIDHVATLRQARRGHEPDPIWAAALAELGGADCITVHLREDRRHIQDRDLEILRRTVAVKLNMELACSREIVDIACRVKPDQATLVPEKREEITTEGASTSWAITRPSPARSISSTRTTSRSVSLSIPKRTKSKRATNLVSRQSNSTRVLRARQARASARRAIDQAEQCRPALPQTRHEASRWPRPELPQRPSGRRDPRHA